jgi:hypothetical protein
MLEKWGQFEGLLTNGHGQNVYGDIGWSDRRRMPLLRPGNILLVDASIRKIDDGNWTTEHDRPIYFVVVREGDRCGRVLSGRFAAGHAAPPALALLARSVAHAGSGRSGGPRNRRDHTVEWAW